MVYETDFYTTRRPYSRPNISSYSVTVPPYYHHHAIPYVAHARLTTTAPPPRSIRVRPSVLVAEIDRITHRARPHLSYQPTEDYLNSRSMVGFDDETRAIRAHTNALLKRIHEPLPPRSRRPLMSLTPHYDVDPPMRITSDAYIQRMLGHNRNVQSEVEAMSYYPEPAKQFIGKGHLACLSFAGGRAISKRRNLAWRRDEDRHIKDEVNFLSHYDRMRTAALGHHVPDGYVNEAPGGLYYLSHSLNRYSSRNNGPTLSAEYVPSKSVVDDMHFSSKVARAEIKEEREKAKTRVPKVEEGGRRKKREEEEEEKRRIEEEEERARKMEERRKEAERKEMERLREEEEERKKREEEERKKKEEEEEKKRKEEEEEKMRKKMEEQRKKAEEEERKRKEEELKRIEEEEMKRKEEEEERKRIEEEDEKKRKEEEEERKRKEEEEERMRIEEEERKMKEEEEEKKRIEEEEERKRVEEEEKRKKDEEQEAAEEPVEAAEEKAEEAEHVEEEAEKVEEEAEKVEEEAEKVEEEAEKVEEEAEKVEEAEPLVEEPTSPEEKEPSNGAADGGPTFEEVPETPDEDATKKLEEVTQEVTAEEANHVGE